VCSKFAVVGLSESLFGRLAKYNIRVSVIIPSYIKTNIFFADWGVNYSKKLMKAVGKEKLDEINLVISQQMYDKSVPVDRAVKRYIAQIKEDQLYVYNTRGTVFPPMALKGTDPKKYEEFVINLHKLTENSQRETFLKYGINLDDYV